MYVIMCIPYENHVFEYFFSLWHCYSIVKNTFKGLSAVILHPLQPSYTQKKKLLVTQKITTQCCLLDNKYYLGP